MAHKTLVCLALVLSLAGCDLLKGKKERPKDRDCEQKDCPKCPAASAAAPGGSASPDGMPGLCDAVGSFAAATDGVRAVMGDVELNRGGVPLPDAERIAEVMVKQGGAEISEPAVAFAAILVRGKQQVWSTTVVSAPKAEARRKDLGRYVVDGGRLPEPATTPEVALGKRLAMYLGAKRGEELTVAALPNMAVPGLAPSLRVVKIVGILDIPGDPVVDYESGLAVMEADDIRTIALLQQGQWGGVRVWYKQGERAVGVLKLQDALRGQQMVNYVTVDQSLAGIGALRPTLEAVCAGK